MPRILSSALAAGLFALAAPAQASLVSYFAALSGGAEVVPNASPGTGTAMVTIDNVGNTMEVSVSFAGLLGPTTAAHIHCCTAGAGTGVAGVATTTPTFPAFPSGVTSGSYDVVFDLTQPTIWNGSFITAHGGTIAGAEQDFLQGLAAGKAYLNIHTTAFPGGEIRGFLAPAAVPEPSGLMLAALGLGLLAAGRRRR